MKELFRYLIRFLLGEDVPEEVVASVGYTADYNQFARYNVVIIPSGFFDQDRYGTSASLPSLPLTEVEGTPLLFGSQKMEWVGYTWVVYADLIASTYFLITRYEEMVRRHVRDEHGRFPGKESLPYRAGFLHRPIVDEYRNLLRGWLRQSRVPMPDVQPQISKVYLTHDVDAPFRYRSWKGMVRSLLDGRGVGTSLQGKFGSLEQDPYYTFPWIFEENAKMQQRLGKEQCETLLFVRSGGHKKQDKPHYRLQDADMRQLIAEARRQAVRIGLHASYQAGGKPHLLLKEKQSLEEKIGTAVVCNRHHYLSLREPEDTDLLEAAGITDDFTMGYADVAGFRLGTSYPVRWINPVTRRLSSLRLHPLVIMDCSLDEEKYMGLSYEEALDYCRGLITRIREVGGELVMLWHNTSFSEGVNSYHRKLYLQLLNELESR